MYARFDEYVSECTRAQRMREFQYESDVNELDRTMNPRRPNWIAGQMCRMLHGMGHLFLGLGRRLDALEQVATRAPEQPRLSSPVLSRPR